MLKAIHAAEPVSAESSEEVRGPVSLDTPLFDEEGAAALTDLIPDRESQGPEQVVLDRSLRNEIEGLLKRLPPREVSILRERFGLDGREPASLEDIGKRLKMTRERIRQIEKKALQRIRHSARAEGLLAYVA
jgi:RNA polymerase primary sigma factor